MGEKMSVAHLWINSEYPQASSCKTFATWSPCLTSAWRPWVSQRTIAGGPGLSLASWELREAWLLWTPSGDPLLCVVSCHGALQATSVRNCFQKKWLNLHGVCWVWREVAGSVVSPVSVLLCCCLYPQMEMPHWEILAWFHLLSNHRAVLWRSFPTYREDSLLLSSPSKRVKACSSVSIFLAEKPWGAEGKWRKQVALWELAYVSGRGCTEDSMNTFIRNLRDWSKFAWNNFVPRNLFEPCSCL